MEWRKPDIEAERDQFIEGLHERFTGGEKYGATFIFFCRKLTLGVMFLVRAYNLALLFALCSLLFALRPTRTV